MKNIRMIVSDLDGTLLQTDKTLSLFTIETIKMCQEKGILVVPATARDIGVLEKFGLLTNPIFDAYICTNGSRIYQNGEMIYRKGLPTEKLREFLSDLLAHFPNQNLSINISDKWYANFDLTKILPFETQYIRSDFSDLPEGLIDRMIMDVGTPENYQLLQEILPDFVYAHTIEGSYIVRILDVEVSKANALQFLCEHLEISIDEIAYFGDDENDLEAFDLCQNKIAVANAIEKVKEKASEVTKSNDEDGVAWWIRENAL